MKRRDFVHALLGSGLWGLSGVAGLGGLAIGAGPRPSGAAYDRLLILVELKGGNDGLNTLVPFADPEYYRLRPRIGIARDAVLKISEQAGLHPSLSPLLPLWQGNELAVLSGVGYPDPNLSHFRSIEIWDTASRSEQTLTDGWLARAFAHMPPPTGFAADGVVIGSQDMGPLTNGRRAVVLSNPGQFKRQARLASGQEAKARGPLAHILAVESDIRQAAAGLTAGLTTGRESMAFATEFPASGFGGTVKTACEVLGTGARVAVLRLTLGGFDTHQNQLRVQENLLKQLADGLIALRSALQELKLWDKTLVMTYAEFGRRPKENQSGGTDHGTANVHFALGGRVRGGLYGELPRLSRLDGNGNPGFSIDYRSLYATALERWWGMDGRESRELLGGQFAPLGFVV